MSQFPAVSPVSSIPPDDTEGAKPPETDTDKDGIPDVHENLFEDWMNCSTVDGRDVIIQGMDRDNAADALIAVDKDGLNATEEYCWPYPANCTEAGFARGLTGMVDEEGDRQYLDPRASDTDGDGMPDGYEAYMCARIGGFDYATLRFDCFRFDPLNASDFSEDPDEDGFDVDGWNECGDINKITGTKYNENGFTFEGFNKNGIHNVTGTKYSSYDFDVDGYDKDGFDVDDNHKMTKTKYDENGYDVNGLDKDGNINPAK